MFVPAMYYGSAIGIHISPPSWISLPPPTPSHPSRLSQSTRFELPHHRVNSYWLLHMIMYMIQCYSLSSSHPLIFKLVRNILITSLLKHFTLCTAEWVSPPFTEWTVHWMQLLSACKSGNYYNHVLQNGYHFHSLKEICTKHSLQIAC